MRRFFFGLAKLLLINVLVFAAIAFLSLSYLTDKFPPDLKMAKAYFESVVDVKKNYKTGLTKTAVALQDVAPEVAVAPKEVLPDAEVAPTVPTEDVRALKFEILHLKSELQRTLNENAELKKNRK